MTQHAVLIAGGGPTGLMLAGELALAGIDVAIIERRANQDLGGRRAGGLHARTIEVLDQRGIAERFLAKGKVLQIAGFNMVKLDISDLPSRRNYGVALTQQQIEETLADWVVELGVPIRHEREVTGFVQDAGGVDVTLSEGEVLRADYLVGCDGGRSLVRKAAGIDFPGWDPTTSWLIAEATLTQEPPWGYHEDAYGYHAIGRQGTDLQVGLVLVERRVGATGEPTLRDVSKALIATYGTDFGIHSPTYVSRFTDVARQAATYRAGRVLLAGDAAHVHPPIGGQGLNIGVQDAVNLGWKLAQVAKGTSPDALLDTYQAERHPVAARVLRTTMAQVALRRTDERTKAAGEVIADLLATDEARRRLGAQMSGLDLHYDIGPSDAEDGRHPLVGRRMPDLDLVTAGGSVRVYALLHDARPVLLNLGEPGDVAVAPWADRVRIVDATYGGPWELPVIGPVSAPSAVLIRPDGHVAWVGDADQPSLIDALTTWLGPPTAG